MSFVFESYAEDEVTGGLNTGAEAGTESETVSAAVSEVSEMEGEVAREDAEMEQITANEETLTEMEEVVDDVVREGAGLSPTGLALALATLRSITPRARRGIVAKAFNMEAAMTGVSGRKQQTRLVQEGIKESLKAFWTALKNQFKKLWAKIKTWYVKTFSASKKLRDKAEKLLDKVNGMSTTIEHKSFAFSQAASVAIGGKAKNSTEISKGAKNLATIVNGFLITVTDSESDRTVDAIERTLDKLERAITSGADLQLDYSTTKNNSTSHHDINALTDDFYAAVKEQYDNLSSALHGSGNGLSKLSDKVLKSIGLENSKNSNNVILIGEFPGEWNFVMAGAPDTGNSAIGKNTEIEKRLKLISDIRLILVNTKEKPKEYDSSTEVQTLSTSEMRDILGAISDGCETIFQYEKKWEKVDKHQDRVLKLLDDFIKDIEDDSDANTNNAKVGRKIATTTTRYYKMFFGFPASLSGKAMTTFSALYNYCEQSISNYRK